MVKDEGTVIYAKKPNDQLSPCWIMYNSKNCTLVISRLTVK